MATQQGYRLVQYPRPGDDETVPYSGYTNGAQGDSVVTEPNTTASDAGGFYVWTSLKNPLFHQIFLGAGIWFEDRVDGIHEASFAAFPYLELAGGQVAYMHRRFLFCEWDDGDILETTAQPAFCAAQEGHFRFKVTEAVIGDEVSCWEASVLALSDWPGGPSFWRDREGGLHPSLLFQEQIAPFYRPSAADILDAHGITP